MQATSAVASRMPDFRDEDILRLSRELNEPEWLANFRLDAITSYRRLEVESSLLFQKYVGLTGADLGDFEYLVTETSPEQSLLSQPNSHKKEATWFSYSVDPTALQKSAVRVMDLSSALSSCPELLRRAFESKAVRSRDDKFAAMINALFNRAIFIHVPANVALETPVHIHSKTRPGKAAAIYQIIILTEALSSAVVLQEGSSVPSGRPSLEASAVDVQVGPGSHVAFAGVNDHSNEVYVISNKRAVVDRDASVSWTLADMGGSVVRGRLESEMIGQGSSSDDVQVIFGNGTQKFDMTSNINLSVPNTTGTSLSKAVLNDSSESIMKGMVKIRNGAKNSRAYLSLHAMLLSKSSRAEPIPTLEIDTNEVKATHSAAVEQIDPEQVFYLTTRGLGEDTAKRLIMLSFFEKAVERVPSPTLRMRIRALVTDKWLGRVGTEADHGEDSFEWALNFASKTPTVSDIFEGHYKYRKTVEG
jgi:Fe-S cluster assembly protein SufB/Fe-S cluster assembly protein SufD